MNFIIKTRENYNSHKNCIIIHSLNKTTNRKSPELDRIGCQR